MKPTLQAEMLAERLTPIQRSLVLAAADADDWLQAFMLGYRSGHDFANGGTVLSHMPYGLFDSKMGGAQCNVYRLNSRGQQVAQALRASDTPKDGEARR
jgi:hypothetical protein